MAKGCARRAGQSSRSSQSHVARGSGFPFVYDPGPELLSMEAIANPPAYDRARAAVRYDDVARTLVHALKYQDRTDLAPAMGRWMARAGAELLQDADMLIPVPLHWRRGFGRRYNQSALLARAIARQSSVALKGELLCRCVRPNSRSGCRAPSAPAMCRAHFRYPSSVGATSRDGASCWSTTS